MDNEKLQCGISLIQQEIEILSLKEPKNSQLPGFQQAET